MNPDELYIEIKKLIKEKEDNKRFPTYVLSMELYKLYGRSNVRKSLVALVNNGRVLMGNTLNDYYFKIG